jgi:NTE family protein
MADVVLSSGFLAFAAHCGFLAALEDARVPVDGVCGTSSGALCGALWLAGMPAAEILRVTTARAPLSWVRWHHRPWAGIFRLDPMLEELGRHLPATFAELRAPLAVGVVHAGAHLLLDAGALVPAVAGSCAVPTLFAPVSSHGRVLVDGAARDRFGWAAWRGLRGDRETLVHAIDSTSDRFGGGLAGEPAFGGAVVVRSPRSGGTLWRLPDPAVAFERTRQRTREALG